MLSGYRVWGHQEGGSPGQAEHPICRWALPLPTLAPIVAHSIDLVLGTTGLSRTAFIHSCVASISPTSHRTVSGGALNGFSSLHFHVEAGLAGCCSIISSEPTGPLPSRTADIARPRGSSPRAVKMFWMVLQAQCPLQVLRKGWCTCCTKDSETGSLETPMVPTLWAGMVDMLSTTCCQHLKPCHKWLLGAPHGLSL